MANPDTLNKICNILNKAWETLPTKPNYSSFNRCFSANTVKLRELADKEETPIIANLGKTNEGLSIVSIIRTISEGFVGGVYLQPKLEKPKDSTIPMALWTIVGFEIVNKPTLDN